MAYRMSTRLLKAHLLWFSETNQTWLTIQAQLQTCLDLKYLRLILSLTTSTRRRLHSRGHNRTYQRLLTLSNIEWTICKGLKWCSSMRNTLSQSCHNIFLHGDTAATAGLLQELLLIGSRYRWRGLATANLNFWLQSRRQEATNTSSLLTTSGYVLKISQRLKTIPVTGTTSWKSLQRSKQ